MQNNINNAKVIKNYVKINRYEKYICIMINKRKELKTKMFNTIQSYYQLKPGKVFDM